MTTTTAELPAVHDDLRRGRRPSVRAVVVAAVLMTMALGGWALRPDAPTLLGDRTGVGFIAAPLPLAESGGFAGITLPDPHGSDDEIITFREVPTVTFTRNTAVAAARVLICVRRGIPYGAGPVSELRTWCREVRDIEPGTELHWRRDAPEYLVVVVTPTRPGVAEVDRITFDYERSNGERGRDSASVLYTVRAS